MLNYLWAGMMMLGIIYAAFTGRMPDITNAALDSSKEAITLCITMIGIMSFWVGLMEIATKAGIIEQLSRKLKPLIHFLFPNLPDNHPAATHITTNIIANILGLGWAATPAGLNAMEELKNLDGSSLPVLAAAKSSFAGAYMDYEIDRARAEKYGAENISFSDFVKQALVCMEKEEKFFLFAEAGKIDTACSEGDMISSMYEVKALDDAVAEAIKFYEKHPEETLIVVLADHETGSMRIRTDMDCSQIFGQVASYARFELIMQELYEKKAPFSEAMENAEHYFGIVENQLEEEEKEELKKAYTEGAEAFTGELCKMKADKAKIQLVSDSHSGQPVPVYAIGKGAEIFSGVYDNTEIYEKLNTIMDFQE